MRSTEIRAAGPEDASSDIRGAALTRGLPRELLLAAAVGFAAALAGAQWPQHGIVSGGLAILMIGMVWLSVGRGRRAESKSSLDLNRDKPLVVQVLPVWRRQIDAARSLSDETTAAMLLNFASIDEGLESAIRAAENAAAGLSAGASDEFIREQESAIAGLLEPLQRSTQARLAMTEALSATMDGFSDLRAYTEEIRMLARRTNIVAFNASVEATRSELSTQGSGQHGGFGVVAQEVRALASQSTAAVSKILKLVGQLEVRLRAIHSREMASDLSDDELRAQTEQSARHAVSALLAKLRDVGRSGRGLREASNTVRSEVERAMVGFQSNDRISQMIGSITEDIGRMHEWLLENQDQSPAQAVLWLARLEQSYTMEDQRSEHHGHGAIDRSAGVEFF